MSARDEMILAKWQRLVDKAEAKAEASGAQLAKKLRADYEEKRVEIGMECINAQRQGRAPWDRLMSVVAEEGFGGELTEEGDMAFAEGPQDQMTTDDIERLVDRIARNQ